MTASATFAPLAGGGVRVEVRPSISGDVLRWRCTANGRRRLATTASCSAGPCVAEVDRARTVSVAKLRSGSVFRLRLRLSFRL